MVSEASLQLETTLFRVHLVVLDSVFGCCVHSLASLDLVTRRVGFSMDEIFPALPELVLVCRVVAPHYHLGGFNGNII